MHDTLALYYNRLEFVSSKGNTGQVLIYHVKVAISYTFKFSCTQFLLLGNKGITPFTLMIIKKVDGHMQ